MRETEQLLHASYVVQGVTLRSSRSQACHSAYCAASRVGSSPCFYGNLMALLKRGGPSHRGLRVAGRFPPNPDLTSGLLEPRQPLHGGQGLSLLREVDIDYPSVPSRHCGPGTGEQHCLSLLSDSCLPGGGGPVLKNCHLWGRPPH